MHNGGKVSKGKTNLIVLTNTVSLRYTINNLRVSLNMPIEAIIVKSFIILGVI